MKISFLRIAVCAVVGTVVIGALLACCFLRSRTTGVDTSTVRKEIRFYRSGTEWFADVPQHTKAENQMVAGADTLLEEVSDGADEVFVVLSSDIPNPDEWKLHLHIVEHDKFGATYKVKAAGQEGVQIRISTSTQLPQNDHKRAIWRQKTTTKKGCLPECAALAANKSEDNYYHEY